MTVSLLVLASCSLSYAQQPTIDRSTAFEEPEDGATRLLMMKNGNTLFFHFTPKKGINVTVYDEKHHAKAAVRNSLKLAKNKYIKVSQLAGLYEINGQAVAFIRQRVDRHPGLYRLCFDNKTGKLVDEVLVADFPKGDQETQTNFHVRKDPNSEYYAIALYNNLAEERGKRIQIIHYAPDHKEINKAYYESPAGTFKNVNFQDMYVNRDEFVFVTGYTFNNRGGDEKGSSLMISRLMKGSPAFQYSPLDYTRSYQSTTVAMKYNSNNHLLYMATSISAKSVNKEATMHRDGKMGSYVLEMTLIDPASLKVQDHFFVNHPDLDKYAQKHLKYKKPYYGAIQNFNINPDNTISFLYEEMDIIEHSYSYTTGGANGAPASYHTTTTYSTRLGEIGITQTDQKGKELNSYAIPKRQYADAVLDMWYQHQRPHYDWTFRGKKLAGYHNNISGFFSYDYIFAHNTGFAIYNDYADNVESEDENYRKKKRMKFISDANTIYAFYDGKNITKGYLFGEPDNNNISRFCQLEMNTRTDDSGSFATMMIERTGRKKKAYIVWVKL